MPPEAELIKLQEKLLEREEYIDELEQQLAQYAHLPEENQRLKDEALLRDENYGMLVENSIREFFDQAQHHKSYVTAFQSDHEYDVVLEIKTTPPRGQ